MARSIVVVTGGDPAAPHLSQRLPVDAFVIAADSGLDNARRLELPVDLLVGDLDSVDRASLARALDDGVALQRHPAAKDRTDLQIALDAACDHGPASVVVVGGHGGRLDHFLANALVLAADAYAPLRIEAFMGTAHLHVVRDHGELSGTRGELVSLLPVHGTARQVTTEGLLYPLRGEDLDPGSTRGVSNEFLAADATVRLRDGVLLAVQPGALGTHVRDLDEGTHP